MANRPKAFLGLTKDFILDELAILGWTCVVDRTHDGDTSLVIGSLGLNVYLPFWVRIFNLLAPELSDPGGHEALAAIQEVMPDGRIVKVRTYYQTFDRWAGVIRLADTNENVSELLLARYPDLFTAKGVLVPTSVTHINQARARDYNELLTRSSVK